MKSGGDVPAQGLGPLRQRKSRCPVREFLLLNGGTGPFGEGLLLLPRSHLPSWCRHSDCYCLAPKTLSLAGLQRHFGDW